MTSLCQPLVDRFLHAQPWFATLLPAEQGRLLAQALTLHVAKGDTALRAGAPVEGWYAVLSGLVMLESEAVGPRRSGFIGVPDGEWFGEGSALKAERRRYNVVALRESWLLCLPLTQFDQLKAQSLAFNQHLVEHLNMRLGQAMTLIEAGRMRAPEHRVALYLSRIFWRHTRQLRLTQEELGHLVGLSRQTVNRALGQLAERGIVAVELGRVHIRDDHALAQFIADTAHER